MRGLKLSMPFDPELLKGAEVRIFCTNNCGRAATGDLEFESWPGHKMVVPICEECAIEFDSRK